jgi:hypothetical protein
MTTSTKVIPAKAPKIKVAKIKSAPEAIEADASICEAYSLLINQVGEVEFILEMNHAMAKGFTSVRIIQASIDLASTMGSAPTIKKGHVQYFEACAKIIETQEGANKWPVSKLLKLATRLQRHAGKELLDEALEVTSTIEELNEAVPVIASKKRGTNGPKINEPVKLRTIEEILAVTLAGLQSLGKNPKDLKVKDPKTLNAVMGYLKVVGDNSK